MASILSILKTILNVKLFHSESQEVVTETVHKYGEDHVRQKILIHCRPIRREQGRCPVCGRKCSGYDDKNKREVSWRGPNLNGIPVYLLYEPSRIECPQHGVLTENIPWADGDSRFTKEFNNEVAWLVGMLPRTQVADFMMINWRTVGNCVSAARARLEPDVSQRIHDGLKHITVDETSYKKGHKYITVISDMDRNRVVWIGKGHGLAVFETFCEALTEEERAKIELVAGDGAKWIDQCVSRFFPNAVRCVDTFHVVQWATEALDCVRRNTASKAVREYNRRREQFQQEERDAAEAMAKAEAELNAAKKELASLPKRGRRSKRQKELEALIERLSVLLRVEVNGSEPDKRQSAENKSRQKLSPEHQAVLDELERKAKGIKGFRYALLHNPENRTENQDDQIRLIENQYPDLYQAFQLKESLRLILHMQDFELASIKLIEWITEAAGCGLHPISKLSDKISRHQIGIINAIKFHANSAKSEAVNSNIKVLIKVARGFRNIDNMIDLIYLKCSDIEIPLNNRPRPSAQYQEQQRERVRAYRRARREAMKPSEVQTL